MPAPIPPIPADVQDFPTLITALNQTIDMVNSDMMGLSASSNLSVAPPPNYGNGTNNGAGAVESNAFTYSNPDVNVYDFLDPLFQALRQNSLLVTQSNVAVNAIGNQQLQVDSVSANNIQANAITTVKLAAGSVTTNILAANSVTAAKIDVSELDAISANLGTITAGNITLDTAGFIRGGSSAYATGTGFWMGYSSGTYQFSIGSSSQHVTWDGSTLTIVGTLSATTGTIGGWTISSTTITGGNMILNSTGIISAGQTAYNTGTGFWLNGAGTPTFSIGNGSTNYMTWDGTTFSTSGTIGNSSVSGSINVGTTGNVRGGQTGYNTGTGFFLGYSSGAYVISLGNAGHNALTWDGTSLGIVTTGTVGISNGTSTVVLLTSSSGGGNLTVYDSSGSTVALNGGVIDVAFWTSPGVGQIVLGNNLSAPSFSLGGSLSLGLQFGDGTGPFDIQLYRASSGVLQTNASIVSAAITATGYSHCDRLSLGTNGDPGTNGYFGCDRIFYSGSNGISFAWNGTNVKVYVDGLVNGTIPNP